MVANALPGLRRRNVNETAPIAPEPKARAAAFDAADIALMIREAVHLEMRSTVRVELQNKADMKDRALIILAAACLAAIIALGTALAFHLYGPAA